MLSQYKNFDSILTTNTSISGDRISADILKILQLNNTTNYKINATLYTDSSVVKELHIYSGKTWITGNHNLQTSIKTTSVLGQVSTFINVDIFKECQNLNLLSGNYRFVVNFFKNLIGSYIDPNLYIDDISPDRTELRLRAVNKNDTTWKTQITNFHANHNQTKPTKINPNDANNPLLRPFNTYVLNFSRNKCFTFVNHVWIGEYLYIRLSDPLPASIRLQNKCWVSQELKNPYIDRINIAAKPVAKVYNTLKTPNWSVNASYNISTETGFKNWTDLLGSSVQTSQQIVDTYFSGSLQGIKLNIDYSDFNNFIFYSSAAERVANFRYKLELIDYYTAQSASSALLSGVTAIADAAKFKQLQTNLVSGFDSFERYLYFESSSKLTTHNIPVELPNVPDYTGSFISPAPKSTSTLPYTLYPVTSSQFTSWYNNLYESASIYDSKNLNALRNTIPMHIRYDESNSNIQLFADMLGQHFDIIYVYINHMMKIHKREENPKLGMPSDLLYPVAKQFGWNLINGNQNDQLWSYVFGTSETGVPLTGSNSVNGTSLSKKEITETIWRRIVNNLPLLLKSKGTKRSIYALLSCYGIPKSLISINEYGGPRDVTNRLPVYENINDNYSLDLINNPSGSVKIDYTSPIQSIEFRFKTDNVIDNPLLPSTMNLLSVGSNTVTLQYSSGTNGTIRVNGVASSAFEIFDGNWITAVIRKNGTKLEVIAKKSKYGTIVSTVSSSATATFPSTGTITFCSSSTGAVRLQGGLQEIRVWSSSLNESVLNNHTKAPGAYNGNIDTYSELMFRLPLTEKCDHSLTSSLSGVQPKSGSMSASFASWTTNTPYAFQRETYYYDSISAGTSTYDSNKVRLESNSINGVLSPTTRFEYSAYDDQALDSNQLGVYYSPQTMIDEDIIAQFGYIDLDNYIGDPSKDVSRSYPALLSLATEYWKKYTNKPDINEYIRVFSQYDMSFFSQLEQLLPGRANKVTGILIQPTILERSKDSILPTITQTSIGNNTNVNGLPQQPQASVQPNPVAPLVPAPVPSAQPVPTIPQPLVTPVAISSTAAVPVSVSLPVATAIPVPTTEQHWNGTQFITAELPNWYTDNIQNVILNVSDTEKLSTTGLNNLFYVGSKISSPDININSSTVGVSGPVVEINIVSGNQLTTNNNATNV